MKLLLGAPGIDVNRMDKIGRTPLRWASFNGHAAVVKLLLGAPGIDVMRADKQGQTPLEVARTAGQSAEMVAILEERMVKLVAGPTILALVRGGVPRKAAASLAIRGLGDAGLQDAAERMCAGSEP